MVPIVVNVQERFSIEAIVSYNTQLLCDVSRLRLQTCCSHILHQTLHLEPRLLIVHKYNTRIFVLLWEEAIQNARRLLQLR